MIASTRVPHVGKTTGVGTAVGSIGHEDSPTTLAQLPRQDMQLAPTDRSSVVVRAFETHADLPGVLVVDDGELVGVISRGKFQERLSQPFGLELFLKRPIHDMLNQLADETWVLPAECEVSEATRFALNPPSRQYESRAHPTWTTVRSDVLPGMTTRPPRRRRW